MIGKLIELDFGTMKKLGGVKKLWLWKEKHFKILSPNAFSNFFPEL